MSLKIKISEKENITMIVFKPNEATSSSTEYD